MEWTGGDAAGERGDDAGEGGTSFECERFCFFCGGICDCSSVCCDLELARCMREVFGSWMPSEDREMDLRRVLYGILMIYPILRIWSLGLV